MTGAPRRHAVFVGLFVAGGALALGAAVLTIGDLHDTFSRKVTLSAVFAEVGGLREGDNVWFAGVKVGVVRGLALRSSDEVEVTLSLDREAAAHVPADASARIGSDGLIGNRIVVVSGGTADGPTALDGDTLGVTVATTPADLLATLDENNQNLLAITDDLREITRALAGGEGTLGRLLHEEELYDQLETIAEHARVVGADTRTFTAGLEGVTDRAGAALDSVERGITDPTTPVGALLGDRVAGSDVRATLANLREGSQLLSEDLEAVRHNFLFRRFFRKAERERERAAAAAASASAEPVAPTP